MQFYFFRSPDKAYSSLFRKFAVEQNVATARVLSIVTLIISSSILCSTLFIDYDAIVPNYSKHRPGTFLLCASALYYLSFFILKKVNFKYAAALRQFFSLAYAMSLLSASMWLTFLAQNNPKNTMAFLLMGIFTVSVLWVLEAWESVVLMLLTLGVFYFGLQYFQTDPASLFQNYVLAAVLVVIFFSVSRVIYSYHYNYFLQMKLVEQKNREISLINSNQQSIINVVGHDLRNPLNNIIGVTQLLQDAGTTEEERHEYYTHILNAARDADHIIHDLVDIASGHEKELQKTEVCLNELLRSLHIEWQHRMPNGQSLVFNEPLSIINAYIHPNKMRRVLNNLINNATKFTPKDGIITIELKKLEDKIRISVNDNGIGIPLELQPFLFDRFSRAGRVGLNGERSHGLGLSICMQLVEEHDGKLSLESKEKEGATFHIDIPGGVLA